MSLQEMQDFISNNEIRDLPKPVLELLRDTYRARAQDKRNAEIEQAWEEHRRAGR